MPKAATSMMRVCAGLCAALALGLGLSPATASAEQYGPVADPVIDAPLQPAPEGIPEPLAEAVARALEQSPLVLGGLAELAALQSDLRTARWQRYPSLSAEILATTGGSNVADADGLAVNLALEQPIWSGGGIGSQIDAARFNRDVGRNSLREVRANIQLAIISSYFDALRAFERVRVLEDGIAEHRALVERIERRVVAEVSPLADLTLARSRLVQLEVELTTARELGANAMLRLAEFVGSDVPTPVFPEGDITQGLPVEVIAFQEMMSCAPGMDRLRSEIDVAEAQVRTTRSGLFPQLLLQLSQNEITGARAAIVLRAQTGNGLSRLSAVDSAEARVDQAVAELGQADREARTRLSGEYVILRSSKLREDAGRQASDAARSLLASYQRQFVAGRRSWLDVLNAAREMTSANVAESDARVSAAASATRILALTCRWRPAGV
ncbi:TolC family protein [uncultured Erythrobacter sp.]|uniref:TolC family protein n=1 Tax=uncultured Erythrobacter sp. TaxID=263913 RepID=UPI00260367B4|nr:TolC family protein [uncultured Erythrobacter sp.]